MTVAARPTTLEGVLLIDPDVHRDDRGFFLETYHKRRYQELGVVEEFVQDNHSRSGQRVLRGIHYQDMSAPMAKLVRCSLGRILDVAVDLRAGSPTFGRWFAAELNDETMRQLLIPVGFGHAFLTLSEVAEVQYKCSGFYSPAAEGAIAWNDAEVGIDWPLDDPLVSPRDRAGRSLRDYLKHPAFRYEGAAR